MKRYLKIVLILLLVVGLATGLYFLLKDDTSSGADDGKAAIDTTSTVTPVTPVTPAPVEFTPVQEYNDLAPSTQEVTGAQEVEGNGQVTQITKLPISVQAAEDFSIYDNNIILVGHPNERDGFGVVKAYQYHRNTSVSIGDITFEQVGTPFQRTGKVLCDNYIAAPFFKIDPDTTQMPEGCVYRVDDILLKHNRCIQRIPYLDGSKMFTVGSGHGIDKRISLIEGTGHLSVYRNGVNIVRADLSLENAIYMRELGERIYVVTSKEIVFYDHSNGQIEFGVVKGVESAVIGDRVYISTKDKVVSYSLELDDERDESVPEGGLLCWGQKGLVVAKVVAKDSTISIGGESVQVPGKIKKVLQHDKCVFALTTEGLFIV